MPGRFAIFAAAFVGIGSLSGMALGSFATTARQAPVDATDIHDLSDQIGDTASDYDSSYQSAASTTDMAPDHVPVCRKGCGPTLSERSAGAYFDHSVRQLDNIYGANDGSVPRDYLTPEAEATEHTAPYPATSMPETALLPEQTASLE